MRRSSAVGALFLVTLAAALLVPFQISPAWASCPDEEVIFVYNTGVTAYASAGTFDLRDRDLNSACTFDAEAHSTTHIENTGLTKFAEAGWEEYWDCLIGCVHRWETFWEVKIGTVYYGGFGTGPFLPAPLPDPIPYRFRVSYSASTDSWKFYYEPNATGGYIQFGPSNGQDAAFAHGYPVGETGRRGGTATGASDYHRGLKYDPCDTCAAVDWPTNYLWRDTISNWHYSWCSETGYKVIKDGVGQC